MQHLQNIFITNQKILDIKNFLIDKKVIKSTMFIILGGPKDVKRMTPKAYASYKDKYKPLAEKAGLTDTLDFLQQDPVKRAGTFAYWFDDYLI